MQFLSGILNLAKRLNDWQKPDTTNIWLEIIDFLELEDKY